MLPGTGSGAPLVGFNEEAFYKHGLIGNANAPICRDCMVAYVNGLRRCLEDNYPKPNGGSFKKQSTRLGDDTVAVYWDDESSPVSEMLAMLSGDNPGAIKSLLEAAWKGLRPEAPSKRFYCLLLTGSQGRASLRGMHTSTLEGVKDSLLGTVEKPGYFSCIESAVGPEKPAPISLLLSSLALPGKSAHLPPSLGEELFLNAVLGRPLSQYSLTRAVVRTRTEMTIHARNLAERRLLWQRTALRAALMTLYFQRSLNPKLRMAHMSLDKDSLNPAYRYGRLLAVLERLQVRALKRPPNSGILDRFYPAASTRPATAFPKLLTLAQYHLRALDKGTRFFRETIEEIMDGLDGAKGFLPTLSIEAQGRFALGYFHQRRALYEGSTQTDTAADVADKETKEINQ